MNPRPTLIGLVASVFAGSAAADPPDAPRMVVSRNGAYVINPQAATAWARCVEGMRWDGRTCTGEPLLLYHAEAIARAAARNKADGEGWRLPRVTELQRLVNKGAAPGLDPALFPAAPRGWHWSGTASVDTAPVNEYNYGNIVRGRTNANANHVAFLHAWAVDLPTGKARGDVAKNTRLPVRLVRTAD